MSLLFLVVYFSSWVKYCRVWWGYRFNVVQHRDIIVKCSRGIRRPNPFLCVVWRCATKTLTLRYTQHVAYTHNGPLESKRSTVARYRALASQTPMRDALNSWSIGAEHLSVISSARCTAAAEIYVKNCITSMTLYARDALVKSLRRACVALYLVSVTRLCFPLLCFDVMHCLPLLNNKSDVCQWNLYVSLALDSSH